MEPPSSEEVCGSDSTLGCCPGFIGTTRSIEFIKPLSRVRMLDQLTARTVPFDPSHAPSKELEISIVGLQNAGKSSLVHALTSQPLQPHPVPTVGFTMRKVKVVCDTLVLDHRSTLISEYCSY